MSNTSLQTTTLSDFIWSSGQPILRSIILACAGSIALWVSAKIQIPFWPVPLTLQTFVVLLIGMVFGAKLGALTILLYLFEGAVGLPVFSGTPEKGIGLAYMAGPTGGYLFGFVLAAFCVGFLAERGWDKKPVSTALAMLIGNLIIYATGILWLGSLIGWDKPVLAFGLYPFLLGDLLKIILAAVLLPSLWKLVFGREAK